MDDEEEKSEATEDDAVDHRLESKITLGKEISVNLLVKQDQANDEEND